MRCFVLVALFTSTCIAEPTPREALKPLGILIGSWKGTGIPEGNTADKQKGHWVETVGCEWQFKGNDAWIVITFDKGKYFTKGEVRYIPASKMLELKLTTLDKQVRTFVGQVKDKNLEVSRTDGGVTERLIFALLHENRITYRLESKPEKGTLWTKKYVVGMTKEGVAFADVGRSANECIVSGGTGTMVVMHKGQKYYVCCSGCRDEFQADPEKYVREWEAKKKK